MHLIILILILLVPAILIDLFDLKLDWTKEKELLLWYTIPKSNKRNYVTIIRL